MILFNGLARAHMTAGGYQPPQNPDDPMAVFMMASPTPADVKDMPARELFRVGRHKIYATSFKAYEQEIRDQLQSMLGQHGFNHETDIAAITVNRIPHGYAYSYMGLDDPEWEEGQHPMRLGEHNLDASLLRILTQRLCH